MNYLFTCGGTAGHINPAVAVASRIRAADPSAKILFIGAEGHMECDLVPREGYEIRTVRITNLSREISLEGLKHNLETCRNVLVSVHEAKKIVREFSPDAVVGTGGYVCYPVLRAAHELGIPTVVHESNACPGLTTKLLSHTVNRILVGVEGCESAYSDPSKVIYTGTPVRDGFGRESKKEARAKLGFSEEEKIVFSVWGSLGAGHMNEIVLQMLPLFREAPAGFRMIHVTGKRYYRQFAESVKKICPDAESIGVEIREYVHNMPEVMNAADLVMCRSGASTLSELTYIGKPALLVPSPNVANNHQEKNARVVESAGGAKVMLEGEFDAASMFAELRSLLNDPERLDNMSEASRKLSVADSAERITDIVLKLAGRKG